MDRDTRQVGVEGLESPGCGSAELEPSRRKRSGATRQSASHLLRFFEALHLTKEEPPKEGDKYCRTSGKPSPDFCRWFLPWFLYFFDVSHLSLCRGNADDYEVLTES